MYPDCAKNNSMKLNLHWYPVWVSKYISLLIATFLLSSCGNPLASHTDIQPGHDPGVAETVLPPAKGAEFVSASTQMKKTSGSKYLVQGALSSTTSEILQTTTPNGYKIYSNVQGELVSGGKGL